MNNILVSIPLIANDVNFDDSGKLFGDVNYISSIDVNILNMTEKIEKFIGWMFNEYWIAFSKIVNYNKIPLKHYGGIPQKLHVLIVDDLPSIDGYVEYYDKSYRITIKLSKSMNKMKKVFYHELTHLIMMYSLDYDGDDHSPLFYDLLSFISEK